MNPIERKLIMETKREQMLLQLLLRAWALVVTVETDNTTWKKDAETWRLDVKPLIEDLH